MAALAGALAYVVWLLTGRAVAAGVALLAGGVMAGAVGYARVVLDRHHAGDVLAGYVLGLGAVAAGVAVERRTAPRAKEV
jgi:membrane-associated phospholipid phosphatase